MSRTMVGRGPRRGAGLRARLLAALLALTVLPSLAGAQSVEDKYRMQREKNSRFNLAAGPTVVLAVNQWQCGLNSEGDTCTDVFDSPTGGGGFWPTGSPNQYMFNSGIQVVGIIPETVSFEWAGDTVGAFFMDASGNYAHGTAITDIYNSLDADDLENWPTEGSIGDFPFLNGIVNDTALYNSVLIGRKSASQQDSWVAYWDGDPNKTGGRTHPMGIVVEQRTMAWNYPEGAESVIFLIYKFTNATNNALFQRLNETKYGISLPDGGWTFDSIYVAYDADPDVGATATNNYATGILPFNLSLAYEGPFIDPNFIYPSVLFHAPFFPTAPGIIGMKYLLSPVNPATGQQVGLTSLSQHTNGGAFPDPNTVQRGWRYISLNTDAGKGDPSCSFTQAEVRARRSCYLSQSQSDVRVFIGSGPFSLGPGESATIAVAMYAAATVSTPLIIQNADNKPGIPSAAPGCGDPIRPIEIAAGYISVEPGRCPSETGAPLSQFDVNVVPNSLLGRGLVAQAVFDNKFLLGFAPEAPPFYLVPGNNQVTVVWEPSATETNGDPFIAAAGDPENELFDPNYREFDVEGYRIYRGTSPADLELVAQFDKVGSVFTDVTCITDAAHVTTEPCEDEVEVDISSPLIQNLTVSQLASGDAIVIQADTVLNKEIAAGTARELTNTGVPFAYIDTDVRNGFQYHYKVTAFDVNSVRSVPSSLESAAPTKSVTPVPASTTLTDAQLEFGLFGRSALPPSTGVVGIDAATGTFAGPQPPTDAIELVFQSFAPQLLPPGTYGMTLDSITPDYYGGIYHFSTSAGGGFDIELLNAPDVGGDVFNLPLLTINSNAALRQELIAKGVDAPPLAGSFTGVFEAHRLQWHSGDSDWAYLQPGFWNVDPPNTLNGGSRWFSGANETAADPTVGKAKHGELTGIEAVFAPDPYAEGVTGLAGFDPNLLRRFYQSTWAIRRAADVKVYWGSAGVDSVIDVTHDLPVAFGTAVRATYGFIPDGDGNGLITWNDMRNVPAPLVSYAGIPSGFTRTTALVPLVTQPVVLPTDVTGDHVAEGPGFGIYINGEFYLFQGAPPSNTVWTLRTYSGAVTGSAGTYAFAPVTRNAGVPGLGLEVTVTAAAEIVAAAADLKRVHAVPDPYYAVSQFDRGPQAKELQFVNLPAEATVRIYSLSGVLVDIVTHSDPTGGGMAKWDLRNRSNQFVASGVYFFHVSTPDGKEHVGKFTVVNAGFGR